MVFIGRRTELSQLVDAMHGDDCRMLVLGEAGIGKTRLVTEAATAAQVPLRAGGGLSMLSWMPFLPLRRALDEVGDDRLWRGDAHAAAQRVEDRLGTAALFVDDLHWTDPETIAALLVLVGRVPLVVASRAEGAGARAIEQLQDAGFRTLELAPLAPEDTRRLAQSVKPGLPDHEAEAIAARGGGNPFAVEELARGDGHARSLALSIGARVDALGEAARHDLGLLALAGRPIRSDALADPAVLVRAGMATTGGGRTAIRHALLGGIVSERLSAEDAMRLHAELAARMDDPGEAARHWQLAGEHERSYAAALVAVEAAATAGERSRHLVTAARSASPQTEPDLLLRAAGAAVEAGEYDACGDILTGLPDRPELQAQAHWLRGLAARESGDLEEWLRQLEAGLAIAPADTPPSVALAVESARRAIFVEQDLDTARTLAEQALHEADRLRAHRALARATLGTALYFQNDRRWLRVWPEAIAIAREEHDFLSEVVAANNLVSAHESSGDPAEAARIADELIERSASSGMERWRRYFAAVKLNLVMHAGDAPQVDQIAPRMLAQPLPSRGRGSVAQSWGLALLDLARYDEAMEIADEELPGSLYPSSRHHLRAAAFDATGRSHEALGELAPFLELAEDQHRLAFAAPVFHWAALHAAASSPELPDMQAAFEVPMLRGVPRELSAIHALRDEDGTDTAVSLFDEAAALWAPYHRRGELRCRIAAAQALASRSEGDDVAQALGRLDEIERIARPLGRRAELDAIARMRRALGVRTPAPTEQHGALLTVRERQVLEYVMRGLSDAAIATRLGISARTVESHVVAARRKLGAATRDQAAALAMRS
ncbi:LuxR C-terminal-related transcriptional regulator [Microbacterium sp. ARD32]|uniref:helix-turn-helix transcriptional regulator n=1 Tax=Microbacterium sp. ARD32 TaxID=2962577 RepID=UPI00288116D9|nr:LuxR C-terminal-related transcriptional regulator [Microbacterium sp. ARD32]MDT0156907.1 LuxR C-terminal-related transcriptional regulator [Microbacterium sp. ARD32]